MMKTLNMRARALVICLITTFAIGQLPAQGILKRVLRKSLDKAENKVEDMLVEKASEAIAQKIYKSMSDAFDEMLINGARQDSAYQANYGDSVAIKYGQLADDWMSRMNEAADVPESYAFDHKVYVDITSDSDIQSSVLYLSSEGSVFAMEQFEKGEKRIFLIDGVKDVVILYMENNKGKKSAQAIPNMMGIGAVMIQNQADTSQSKWTFHATGQSKTVAGYQAEEYKSTDGNYENTFYLSDDLDISWKQSFSGFIDRFAGTAYGKYEDYPTGFMMESHSYKVGKTKEESSWITNKVETQAFKILNADYEFGGIKSED